MVVEIVRNIWVLDILWKFSQEINWWIEYRIKGSRVGRSEVQITGFQSTRWESRRAYEGEVQVKPNRRHSFWKLQFLAGIGSYHTGCDCLGRQHASGGGIVTEPWDTPVLGRTGRRRTNTRLQGVTAHGEKVKPGCVLTWKPWGCSFKNGVLIHCWSAWGWWKFNHGIRQHGGDWEPCLILDLTTKMENHSQVILSFGISPNFSLETDPKYPKNDKL